MLKEIAGALLVSTLTGVQPKVDTSQSDSETIYSTYELQTGSDSSEQVEKSPNSPYTYTYANFSRRSFTMFEEYQDMNICAYTTNGVRNSTEEGALPYNYMVEPETFNVSDFYKKEMRKLTPQGLIYISGTNKAKLNSYELTLSLTDNVSIIGGAGQETLFCNIEIYYSTGNIWENYYMNSNYDSIDFIYNAHQEAEQGLYSRKVYTNTEESLFSFNEDSLGEQILNAGSYNLLIYYYYYHEGTLTNYYSRNNNENFSQLTRFTELTLTTNQTITVNVDYEVIDLPNLMFTILTMPFSFISQAFNLTLFSGTPYKINISSLFLGIIAVLVFIFLIKLIISKAG